MFDNLIKRIKIILYIVRRLKVVGCSFFILCSLWSSADAQQRLSTSIHMPKFESVRLRTVFDVLKQEQSILFSYNSNLVDLDKEVDVESYDGLLIDYLEKLIGEQYSFKETHSHIIITYAPQRLNVHTVDLDTRKNNRARVSGYVKDVRTNKPIDFVTVYDRALFQASTSTGKDGYFELDVKNPGNTVTIALSKENYRDTMLVLLLPVEVSDKGKGRKIGYYQTVDSSKTLGNSVFGRFFTSSRQRIQNLNLGGFFVYSPFQISMTPGLSTHGSLNSQVVNKFSLNITGSYTAGVEGTELAGIFNANQFDMRGVQFAGAVNVVGGNVHGFQAAGASNVTMNNVSGVQMAGLWNRADTAVSSLQMAGGMNLVNDARRSTQLAGVLNISKKNAGSQIAGGINIAKKVRGIQLAAINIADSSDYPIGVFNWIKNGTRQLALGIDESGFASLNFKTGGRVLYAILGLGMYIDDKNLQYGVDAGFGGHLLRRNRFTLSGELLQRIQFSEKWKHHEANRISLRIVPAVHLSRRLRLYAAPSITYSESVEFEVDTKETVWNFWGAKPSKNTFHGGGAVGLTYVFN